MRLKSVFLSLSKLERIVLIGALLTFALSLSLKAALYIQSHTEIQPAYGGEFREGLIGQPVFINPIVPTTGADREIAKVVFGSLHDIAESIKQSEDGKTWNIRIKQNIRWHDGTPLTSDDALFTLGVIQDKESRSPLFATFQGVTAERISELEIVFKLQSPYAFFEEEHLKNLSLIPKHIFGDLQVQNLKLSPYGLKPVGFGPYKVLDYEKDGRGVITAFHLAANQDYLKGAPNIANLTFKFYKTEAELLEAYNVNRVDGVLFNTSNNLDLSEDGSIKIRHVIHALKSSRYYAVFINQALGGSSLKNIKVREALSRLIDRTSVTKDVFQSFAAPYFGPTLLSSESVSPYDPTVLKDVKLNVIVPEEEFLSKTADILKTSWERAGAEVNIDKLSLRTIQDKVLKDTNYEMLLFGNIAGTSNDLFSFWHSSKRFYPDPNLALYQNKKVDAALEAFRRNFDEDVREESLKTISDTIAADYPAVFLYSPDYIYITIPSLYGFEDRTMNVPGDRFANIEKWYLKTKRVF